MPDTLHLGPRITVHDAVPLRAGGARAQVALGLLWVLPVIPFAFAIWGDGALYRTVWGSLGLMLLLFAAYVLALARSAPHEGGIRVQATGGLRFLPWRSVNLWPFAVALVGLAPGIIVLIADNQPDNEFASARSARLLVGVSLIAALWLAQSVFALRLKEGLDVSPWGLMGVRGAKPVRVEWAELVQARAVSSRSGARLHLSLRDGSLLVVHGQYIGSDPNVVAAMIEHFRTNVDDRDDLVDIGDAVRAVERASVR